MADDNVQHGIDDNPSGDAGKGALLGGLGGAAVGAVAGGPIGAVVGAIAGAIASGAAVAAVDQVDNDDTVSGVGGDSSGAGAHQSHQHSHESATTGIGASATGVGSVGTGTSGAVGANIPTLNVSRGETSANTAPDAGVDYHQNNMSHDETPLEGKMANNETHREDINYRDPDITTIGTTGNQEAQHNHPATDTNVGTGVGQAGVGTTGNVGATQNAEHIRVPVVEEELNVQKQVQQAGEVQIRKDVITEQVNVPVELTREEVVVTRHAVDRDLQAGEHALGEEEVLRVPVSEETVSVSKQAHVVEEIEIAKQRVTEHQNVTDTVRKEVVDVDDTTTHGANIGNTNRNNTL
jgi:uncharacterized protein (TIGR02271 family)